MKLKSKHRSHQHGLSLFGFIFVIGILALVAILGMKIVPTVVEYSAIKKAMAVAKDAGTNVREIQTSFDRQRTAGYIESVSGKDLEIVKTADGFDIHVAYQKKIELFGPASLVIDYAASTANTSIKKVE